jgi:hypothetical protein
MKTTWNIIHKQVTLLLKKNIKSLRMNKHIVYNEISIAN